MGFELSSRRAPWIDIYIYYISSSFLRIYRDLEPCVPKSRNPFCPACTLTRGLTTLLYDFDYTSGVSACVTTEKQRVVNELVAAALSAAETAAAIAAIVIGVATAELTLAKRVSLVEDAE